MNPIDNKFKQKLEGLEIAPSQHVWERIRAEVPHRKKRPYVWMSAAASIALLISVGLWFGQTSGKQELIHLPHKQLPITHASPEPGSKVKAPQPTHSFISLAGTETASAKISVGKTKIENKTSRGSATEEDAIAQTDENMDVTSKTAPLQSAGFDEGVDDFEIEVILNNPERYLANQTHAQTEAVDLQKGEASPPVGDKIRSYAVNQLYNLRQLQPLESPSEYGLSLTQVKLPFVKVVEE